MKDNMQDMFAPPDAYYSLAPVFFAPLARGPLQMNCYYLLLPLQLYTNILIIIIYYYSLLLYTYIYYYYYYYLLHKWANNYFYQSLTNSLQKDCPY